MKDFQVTDSYGETLINDLRNIKSIDHREAIIWHSACIGNANANGHILDVFDSLDEARNAYPDSERYLWQVKEGFELFEKANKPNKPEPRPSSGMRMFFYAKEGQTHCHDCGREFALVGSAFGTGRTIETHCTSGKCTRGSWVSVERGGEFTVPVMLDVKILRRKIEDRLRKDKEFLRRILTVLQ